MKKQSELTHKEAVKKALEMLGGKATLKQIYPVAIKLIGKNTKSVDIKATIRRELNSSPFHFKSTPGGEGSWELISYQEDIANLKAELKEKDEIIDELQKRPTEDDFIDRLLEKLKTSWKNEKKTINEIRKILDALGRVDVVEKLDACLEGKAKKSKKNIENVSSKIYINGDYVVTKHVDNEVNGVASGGTGINVYKGKEQYESRRYTKGS